MIKKFVFIALLVGLLMVRSAKGQHEIYIAQFTELPPLTLDMAEIIDILADYNVKHLDSIDFGWIGLTAHYSKTIYVHDSMSQADKKETLLHELLHAAYFKKGLQTGDPYSDMLIDQKAQDIYNQLYGFPVVSVPAPVVPAEPAVDPNTPVGPVVEPLVDQPHKRFRR